MKASSLLLLAGAVFGTKVSTSFSFKTSITNGEIYPSVAASTHFGDVCAGTKIARTFYADTALTDVTFTPTEADGLDNVDGDFTVQTFGSNSKYFMLLFSPKSSTAAKRHLHGIIEVFGNEEEPIFSFGVGGNVYNAGAYFADPEDLAKPVDSFEGTVSIVSTSSSCPFKVHSATADSDDFSVSVSAGKSVIEQNEQTFTVVGSVTAAYTGETAGEHTTEVSVADASNNVVVSVHANEVYGELPTETESADCVSYTLANGEPWHDSYGEQYTCGFYEANNECAAYGGQYANEGRTANQACCVCGGGYDPKVGPEELAQCEDIPLSSGAEWNDGYPTDPWTCQDYVDRDMCNNDAVINEGLAANQACCGCQGGRNPETKEVYYSAKEESSQAGFENCQDKTVDGELWDDAYTGAGGAFNCNQYASFESACSSFGGDIGKGGLSAQEACCVCGGGTTL